MPNNMSLGLVFSHSYKTEGADYIVFSTKSCVSTTVKKDDVDVTTHDCSKTTEDFVTVVENSTNNVTQ
jgi:hypothetical protein